MRSARFPVLVGLLLLTSLLTACGGGGGAPASDNAKLSSLTASMGNLVPEFSPGVTTYGAGIVRGDTVAVAATAEDSGASIRVNGAVTDSGRPALLSLPIGESGVDVEVTAEDGITQRIYRIDFDRTSALLRTLEVSAGALEPLFDPAVQEYRVGPSIEPGRTTVTPTAEDPGATVQVNGAVVTSGETSTELALAGGITPVTIDISARDGTVETLTILFDRSLSDSVAYLKASNAGSPDGFGLSLAMSGATLVVGAPFESGDGSTQANDDLRHAGATYVFVLEGGDWVQQAYLKASDPGLEDYFGISVGVSGDTIAVGALEEDGIPGDPTANSLEDSGAVYVFTRQAGNWTQQAYLKAENAGQGDFFGTTLAIEGDTLAVGAPREDSNGVSPTNEGAPDAGAVYVFTREAAVWSQRAYLKASNASSGDEFGINIAVDDSSLLIGANGEDGNGSDPYSAGLPDSGAAYVFVGSGSTWTQQGYLKALNAGENDWLGFSVAIAGDTAVVGAPLEAGDGQGLNDFAPAAGAAYVFTRSNGTWTQQAYLKAANADRRDYFGRYVGVSGDTVVVGAYGESSDGTSPSNDDAGYAGAVYVFTPGESDWEQHEYLKAFNADPDDNFGFRIVCEGNAIVVGSTGESGDGNDPSNNSLSGAGAVYVYR